MNILKKIDQYLEEAVRIDTNEYQNSHGKTPKGRGSWIFAFDGEDDTKDSDKWFTANGTYAEALKAAKAEGKKRGAKTIKVMP